MVDYVNKIYSRKGAPVMDTRLAILLDRLLRRIHMSLHAKAPRFDTEKIGPGGAMILLTLDETGPVPLSVLTKRLARDKSQMTRSVRGLEAKDLIARCCAEGDARVSVVALTEKGRAVVEVHQRAIAQTIDETLTGLDAVEKDALQALLHKAVGGPLDAAPDA